MEKTISIKLCDGVRVDTESGFEIVSGPAGLWELFNWDIDNDQNARECATIITRELFCFGFIDLTKLNNGKKLTVTVIPCND